MRITEQNQRLRHHHVENIRRIYECADALNNCQYFTMHGKCVWQSEVCRAFWHSLEIFHSIIPRCDDIGGDFFVSFETLRLQN